MNKIQKTSAEIKLNDILPAIDKKDVGWWDTLTTEQKDKFQPWLYMRYTSSVDGNADLSRYYLLSTNEVVNKKFNSLRHHPQLQYLLLSLSSPGFGIMRHIWIAPPKTGAQSKRTKLMAELFPNANDDELEILGQINSNDQLAAHLRDAGWQESDIKKALKE